MPIGAAIAVGTLALGIWNYLETRDNNNRNIGAQKAINKQNIEATKEMNALNRQYSLQDFDKTNQYNSPKQQMIRLKEAGLNPNLVYGSGANQTAATIAKTEQRTPNLQAPHSVPATIDQASLSGARDMLNQELTDVSIQNAKAQTKLLEQQGRKNDLEMAGKGIQNATNDLTLQNAKALQDTTIEQAKLNAIKTKTDINNLNTRLDLSKQEMELKKAKNRAEVKSINADITRKLFDLENLAPAQKAKYSREIENLINSGKLQEIDIKLREVGINPSDPSYVRVFVQIMQQFAKSKGMDMLMKLDPTN